jgi:hypothetical protein
VTIEVSASPASYRCEVTRRLVGAEAETKTFAWEEQATSK